MKTGLGGAMAELAKRAHENPHRDPIGMEPANRPVAPSEGVATTQSTPKPKRAAPAAHKRAEQNPKPKPEVVVYPWETANARVPKLFNLRFNEVELAELKYVGETTFGENMHSIAKQAVLAEVRRRLAERGIEVKIGEGG